MRTVVNPLTLNGHPMRDHPRLWILSGTLLIGLCPVWGHAQTAAAAGAIIDQYCTSCHNDLLETGGLSLDPQQLANPGQNQEVWEEVVVRLRAGSMPPLAVPRPTPSEYAMVTAVLETGLDQAARAQPNPGRLPMFHRLTRSEYQNAIRDILSLDALPREMDYELLLPPDNASSGFDNIADLLFISPATLDRYLEAARKISRLAVGDTTIPVMVNQYRLSPERSQNDRAMHLPSGTRGGLAIDSYFPVNAEYVIDVEVSGRAREPQQLEILVDGARTAIVTLGSPGPRPSTLFRLPLTAGPHQIAVTFVERNQALDEAILQPKMRSRGTLPAIASVTIRGPYNVSGPGATPSRDRIFTCRPADPTDSRVCAREILSNLVRRAYRRPSSDEDLEDLLPFFEEGLQTRGFDFGIQKALERLLVSPQFLFRIEREPTDVAPNTAYFLSDLELASRLSFFIWSSVPDDALLDLAIEGRLATPSVLEEEVRRMLADPRAESLVSNFASQWLFLRDVELKEPDPLLFRNFDDTLRDAFLTETELFLQAVLGQNQSVLNLLDADYTFLNERLAEHYGIANVRGSHFRRVTLPEGSARGGLLGQGSILMLTSYSTRTSPVLRGKYVLDNLLSSPPPPPPPDVPALTTENSDSGETLSIREAMIQHRANPVCASCHAVMDPIGFAMENFDAVGRWRTTDAGQLVDASGTFPDGTVFNGVTGLRQILLRDPERFVGALTGRLLMFAIGRNVQYFDAAAVRAIVSDAAANDYRFASLVLGVVRSVPFRMRMSSGPE